MDYTGADVEVVIDKDVKLLRAQAEAHAYATGLKFERAQALSEHFAMFAAKTVKRGKITEFQVMTQTRLLSVIFALMAAVNLFLFFVDGFPNYGFASLCAASAMAAYLIHTKLCRSQS